ncbi:hypothetical protein B7463_g12401, partial [Scytalidium lignicola]
LESSFVDQLPIEAKLNLEPPEPPADEKEPKPKIKARVNIYTSFEQVLQEFLPLDEVSFDPFSPEEYRGPRTKTTRPHAQLPQVFKILKDKFKKELQWNTLLTKVIDNTLCLAWQDNNIVLALTNIHTVDTTETFRDKVRRRPTKTSTSAWQARAPFGNQPTKELAIPVVIDDYNHYIGGVDIANQFKAEYETHRTTFRTW